MSEISATECLEDDGNVLRARSVWLLSHVAFFSWFLFYVLYWTLSIEPAATICGLQCFAYACITFSLRGSERYLLIMNLLMASSIVGFLAVACSSPLHRGVIDYVPILILVAAQLFGRKQALVWLLSSLAAMTLFFFLQSDSNSIGSNVVGLAIFLGVPCCVYFCCHLAEVYYEKKTEKLVVFSQELQRKADDLQVLATTDALTKLPNRYQFQNELTERVEASGEAPFALFLIDMDRFKEINDTMGHSVGDEVLVEVGSRLANHCGPDTCVGRLGGDEFCVIYDGVDSPSEAAVLGQQLHDVLSGSYAIAENMFSLGASIGFALYPSSTTCPKLLLAFADTAMYHAKHNQLPVSCHSPEMTERLEENRILNDRLASGIENKEFLLLYQPQFDIQTGQVTGAEALLRWCMNGELVGPHKFIPLLEQSGQMIEVSKWILDEACRQQVEWRDQGFDIRVAINISAIQFEDPNFVDHVLGTIEKYHVEPNQIDLEITEGLLINNVSSVVAKLNQIRDVGIQISIDDFGTGYSSLAYLRQFPIDQLKIDQAFVRDIPESDDGAIASSIILLGQVLGMRVLAEGVETPEQLEYLRAQDCNEFQGFLYSKPETPEKIFSRFASRSTTQPADLATVDPA